MSDEIITQEQLKKALHYNPEIGLFTRIKAAQRVRVGDVAGCKTGKGYIKIMVYRKPYLAHRLAWLYVYGEWPEQIDHINHITNDNRIINLRSVTNQENHKNRSMHKKNTSGITGVCRDKATEKWRAQICANGKVVYLGEFTNKSDAVKARKAAENKYGFHALHGKSKASNKEHF